MFRQYVNDVNFSLNLSKSSSLKVLDQLKLNWYVLECESETMTANSKPSTSGKAKSTNKYVEH